MHNDNNSEFDRYSLKGPEDEPQSRMPAPVTPSAVPKRERRRGNVRLALLFALCLIFASAAGFAGGFIASTINFGTSIYSAYEALPIRRQALPSGNNSSIYETLQETPDVILTEAEPGTSSLPTIERSPAGRQMTKAEVSATVRNSVVEIQTERVTAGLWGSERVTAGSGSGVIISADGLIITNSHVISETASISVRLADGRVFDAELVGEDPGSDTAVIKIEATGLSPVVFGDSDALVVGESALAVGNPLGQLGGTVTSGIISALDRDIVIRGEIMTVLQTDAAVNPGNSGGGLFNLFGELIGIVVARSGGGNLGGANIEGLGFAIPANTAKLVTNDLLTYGYVRGRADAGLELVDIQTAQLARRHGVSQFGLYILDSEYEGLLRGDRIVAISGRGITGQLGFNAALRNRNIGDTISITVMRAGQEVTVSLTLTEWSPI